MYNKKADIERRYLEFVRKRSTSMDLRALEKLKVIEELASIIFEARKNYRKQSSNENSD